MGGWYVSCLTRRMNGDVSTCWTPSSRPSLPLMYAYRSAVSRVTVVTTRFEGPAVAAA